METTEPLSHIKKIHFCYKQQKKTRNLMDSTLFFLSLQPKTTKFNKEMDDYHAESTKQSA